MKKISIGLCFLTVLFSCQNAGVEKPDKVIDKDKMVDILYDLSLMEAMKSQNISDSDYTINSSQYIYKKYKVDSLQFVQNNKYYASDIDGYKKMFEKVKARLDEENAQLEKKMKKNGEMVTPNSDAPQVQ